MTMIFLVFSMVIGGHAGEKKCTVSFDMEKSKVEGTGYKYTEKAGVTAKFVGFEVSKKSASSVDELMKDLKVTVDLMSIDSGNDLRDRNMREALFSLLKDDAKAILTVKKMSGKKLEASMKLNGVEKPVSFEFAKSAKEVTASSQFDLLDYSGKSAIASIARRCKALHTGKDGKSKTWSDFAIKVTAKLIEKCTGK